FAEMQTEMALDSHLSFRDLWTTVAYTKVSTVWSPLVAGSFFRPRKGYPDPELGDLAPYEVRMHPSQAADRIAEIRGWTIYNKQAFLTPHERRAGLQSRVCDENQVTELEYTFKLAFPEPFRKRTLLLVVHTNPHYVDQLPPHEQRNYAELFPTAVG